MKMNKKGITLVEVIVVLVIMAILAGVLVASYTGYIDKAQKDKAEVEARAVYLAVVSAYHEEYAKNPAAVTAANVQTTAEQLSGITGITVTVSGTDPVVLSKIVFTASNNEVCTFTFTTGVNGSWQIGS